MRCLCADSCGRTNASPIYVVLFLLCTALLNRPCVYCSILLCVLIFTILDFSGDWFEARWQPSTETIPETLSSLISGNVTIRDAALETASIAVSAINGTSGAVASAAVEGVRKRIGGGGSAGNAFEWLRSVMDKRSLRIPCVDVTLRL